MFTRPAVWLTLVAALVVATAASAAKTKQPAQLPKSPVTENAAPVDADLPSNAAYFAPALRTNSATLAYNASTGLHASYAGFGDDNKGVMYYAPLHHGRLHWG